MIRSPAVLFEIENPVVGFKAKFHIQNNGVSLYVIYFFYIIGSMVVERSMVYTNTNTTNCLNGLKFQL